MKRQELSGGNDSTNIQVDGGMTLVHQMPVEAVRAIAHEVFQQNFLTLSKDAADLAAGRAARLIEDYLKKLQADHPDRLGSASDPDVQYALFEAQSGFARSGDEDLAHALTDLLVDRAAESQRTTRAIALNEAIVAAPKLSTRQRRAIAVCFLLRYTTWRAPLDLNAFYEHLSTDLLPLVQDLPEHDAEYQHIASIGAGDIEMGAVEIGVAIIHQIPGCFTRGFLREEVPELVDVIDRACVPCIRDTKRLQLAVAHRQDVPKLAAAIGREDLTPLLEAAFGRGSLTPAEAIAELEERVPALAAFVVQWQKTPISRLSLTSVGLAIGHGYWQRITGNSAPLSIWLPT